MEFIEAIDFGDSPKAKFPFSHFGLRLVNKIPKTPPFYDPISGSSLTFKTSGLTGLYLPKPRNVHRLLIKMKLQLQMIVKPRVPSHVLVNSCIVG